MRARALLPVLLLAGACGDRGATVAGDLQDAGDATDVWVLGGEARSAVAEGAFELAELEGDSLFLRFSRGDDEVARMDVLGLPEGGSLRLERVWMDDGLAFPSAVRIEGADVVEINGLRWGSADRLPDELEERATLLSRGGDDDALLVRPLRADLPDLRVVVTPGTRVTGEDGEPADLEALSFGDTLSLSGSARDGFLVATEVVLPRRAPDEERDDAEREDAERDDAPGRGERGRGRGRGR